MENDTIIDISGNFPNALSAERKGANTLILRKMHEPIKRFDGKRVSYELEYRWHKSPQSDTNSVQGQEFTFWSTREIRPLLSKRNSTKLFDFFQLC